MLEAFILFLAVLMAGAVLAPMLLIAELVDLVFGITGL